MDDTKERGTLVPPLGVLGVLGGDRVGGVANLTPWLGVRGPPGKAVGKAPRGGLGPPPLAPGKPLGGKNRGPPDGRGACP